MSEMIMAAQRDASFFRNPDCTHVKQYHIVSDGYGSRCGTVMLDTATLLHASHITDGLRCQRNGCKQKWPKESGND